MVVPPLSTGCAQALSGRVASPRIRVHRHRQEPGRLVVDLEETGKGRTTRQTQYPHQWGAACPAGVGHRVVVEGARHVDLLGRVGDLGQECLRKEGALLVLEGLSEQT